jgi:chromosome segregation ATPase
MDWLAKLIDPATWKKVGELYWSEPLLLVPLALVGVAVWGLLALINTRHVSALNTRIEGLKDQISDLQARLRDTRDDLRTAKAEQERVTNELNRLKDENAKLAAKAQELQRTAQPQPNQVNLFIAATSGMAITIDAVSRANTALGQTLSGISGKLEATEQPDSMNAIAVAEDKKK